MSSWKRPIIPICAVFSTDGPRLIGKEFGPNAQRTTWLFDGHDGAKLFEFSEHCAAAQFSKDGRRVHITDAAGLSEIWERRRPERWWGLAWLPEFWLTALFASLFLVSLVRDGRPA